MLCGIPDMGDGSFEEIKCISASGRLYAFRTTHLSCLLPARPGHWMVKVDQKGGAQSIRSGVPVSGCQSSIRQAWSIRRSALAREAGVP